MREVILVSAPWCSVCKSMEEWFFDIEIPGVKFRLWSAEEIEENISTVPTILFRENGRTVQTVPGAMAKYALVSLIRSVWPEGR